MMHLCITQCTYWTPLILEYTRSKPNKRFRLMGLVVVVSVLPLGRFLVSMFSILSCFPSFSLNPHTTLLSETHLAYPVVFFHLVFFLSSDPISPPLAGFHL